MDRPYFTRPCWLVNKSLWSGGKCILSRYVIFLNNYGLVKLSRGCGGIVIQILATISHDTMCPGLSSHTKIRIALFRLLCAYGNLNLHKEIKPQSESVMIISQRMYETPDFWN